MIAGIYKITCVPNGKVYIGMSEDIKKRWSAHRTALTNPVHPMRGRKKDVEEFGIESFKFEVLEVVEDNYTRLVKEIEYINEYKSYKLENGYNQLVSGDIVDVNDRVEVDKGIQVKFNIPTEYWDMVGKLAAMRTIEGDSNDTKKAVVADAIREYYERQNKKG